MVGIVSNNAALFAQRNLATASSTSESSIARLSSGNAIVSAADDVAGLAIGTVLRTTVSTLKTILNSAAQATSLLGIADAGLQNIGEILQRQKSLAVQANTGSLSNNERAFLDQEFQNLVSEINRIVENTKFNGIALLNGSISGSAGLTTATTDGTFSVNAATDYSSLTSGAGILATDVLEESPLSIIAAVDTEGVKGAGSMTFGDGFVNAVGTQYTVGFTLAAPLTDGETFTFAGATLTFQDAPAGVDEAGTGGDVDQQASAIASWITTHAAFAGANNATFTATAVGGVITITANEAGVTGAAGPAVSDMPTNGAITTVAVEGAAGGTITIDTRIYELTEDTATGSLAAPNAGIITLSDPTDYETSIQEIVTHLNSAGQQANADIGAFEFSYDTSAGVAVLTATAKTYSFVESSVNAFESTFDTLTVAMTDSAEQVNVASLLQTFNTGLIGSVSNLQAQYVAGNRGSVGTLEANAVIFTATINGQNYTSEKFYLFDEVAGNDYATNLGTSFAPSIAEADGAQFMDLGADQTQIRFFKSGQNVASDKDSGFALTVSATFAGYDVADQSDATALATLIQEQLDTAGFNIAQNRELSSVDVSGLGTTVLSGLTADQITLSTAGYAADGSFGDVGAFLVDTSADTITVTINGKTFTSDLTTFGNNGGSGNLYGDDTADNVIGINTTAGMNDLVFTSADGENLTINLDDLNVSEINLTTDSGVLAFESALNSVFSVTTGSVGALNFQVGTTASDSIGLSLGSAATTSIYIDDSGNAVTLSVATSEGAIAASDVLDTAINTVTSLRATVGALQSRFNFAAANVNASIQNTEAARSIFLDVDIAEESTKFATAQVRLQASISVLAQANQIPQNLLKLIG